MFTPGASYRITPATISLAPIFTRGASYQISSEVVFALNGPPVIPLTARAIQQDALDQLIALRTNTRNKKQLAKLDEVAEHLTRSLDPDLWIDPSHLNPNEGERVFDENQLAINKLRELLRRDDDSVWDAMLLELIDRIATANRELALFSVGEALAASGEKNDLAAATREIRSGDGDVFATHYRGYIDDYQEAWKTALAVSRKKD